MSLGLRILLRNIYKIMKRRKISFGSKHKPKIIVQLKRAVIRSTATADKNRLETGTLGWNDIENHADYKVEHQSAGISTEGSIAGQFAGNMANRLMVRRTTATTR